MQLKQPKSIRRQLTIATSSLLVAAPLQSIAVENSVDQMDDITVEISRLYYSEDDRVTVNKTQALITNELSEDNRIKVNVTYDTMSGSSPNGRIYTGGGDGSGTVAVTTASGFSFNAANNASSASKNTWLTPFSDNRIAANMEWETSLTNFSKAVLGGGASFENDYESYSTGGKLLWDLNQRRTTLTAGIGYNSDTVKPEAGVPEGLGELWCGTTAIDLDWLSSCADQDQIFYKPANKTVVDYFFGITQVWNRNTLFQLNYSQGDESGYLTDPYKQVSVIDPEFGNQELAVLYEKRPDSRLTQSLYFKAINVSSENITSYISYRYFWDDWDIQAHTVDAKIRINLGTKSYIQPHVRASYQSAASFSSSYISVDDAEFVNEPQYISADHRLSEQGTVTAGIKYGRKLGKVGKFGARVEQMRQKYNDGVLPDMKAWIVNLLLSMRF